ncbi:hypothetical protein P691DRAFT_660489 [Macrolepiota fuliginosa MF-IS2]|uniref:Uncharacterized protein n=1 Tax=Macrolepiota fuliginosa MF-IS2 TaxID=1400762 RepID=A0A9P5XKM7_9AGAR|nr:hypothetical protein P691DRAFT_660489 [Macrolepiota fuliginosa MF-IS2]
MSLPPPESPTLDQTEEEQAAIKALVDSFAKSNLHDAQHKPSTANEKPSEPRPMRTYTREQLLHLYNSPLVQLPPNMPELKQWFGDNEIVLTKKESDMASNGRGRFRRELEDGDPSSRPSFRSTLSQPSQMGNFKHQSLRSGDRDRERERDGDRDREIRDKEGLRHLSDKYDRDRLGMLPATTRGKEREPAPHSNTNSSNRASSQNQTISARRGDARESQKKRPGETGDDWRRNDASRTTREVLKFWLDRDDRERARSRVRESSRPRRSPSRPRRERDDGRDRPSKSDRDRDDYRKDDYKRERDDDREQDGDPRRWRDDGKRDERMAARRTDRDRDLRPRERGDHWEPSSDRRWAASDDRDGRYKRSSGRDRKSGGNGDELKDRDERREREKEKEPAWMETYVPTSTSGILGGKSSTGELDGIQAWKKGLKEKELALQEKNTEPIELDSPPGQDMGEKGLDEIQIFKLLMKQEEEKKKTEGNHSSSPTPDTNIEPKAANHTMDQTLASTLPSSNSQLRPSSSTPNLESPAAVSPSSKDLYPKPQPVSAPIPDILSIDNGALQLSERSMEYNPPAGSRLLALGRTSAKSPVNPLTGSLTGTSNGPTLETMVKPGTPAAQSFSPFEEQARHGEEHAQLAMSGQFDLGQRPMDKSYSPMVPSNVFEDTHGSAYAANKGSRFAKFFDNKPKEHALPVLKSQTPTDFLSSSPNPPVPPQRQEQAIYGSGPSVPERTMDDIFAMLNNSSQAQRANMLNHPTPHHPMNNGLLLNQVTAMNNLPPQHQPLQSNSRLDPLYDSRLDDRFVPDGMVPGLRTAPLPRNRDNIGLYHEMPDEALQFHLQRLQQQQRGPDPFNGPNPSMYGPQGGRNMGLPLHQAQFRGGPSPGVGPHNQVSNLQQRLPPGLANLGGRPPHDPAQLLGLSGHPNAPLHPNLHPNVPPAQASAFNNFTASNLNINPQLRGPIPNLHQLQNTGPHPGLGPMGLGNNMELRSQNPNQMLNLGGPNLPGPRGNTLYNPQNANHLQGPVIGSRQQQAHLPPHVPPHLMPPHFQQGPNGPSNGHTNELIALLMGGAPRE